MTLASHKLPTWGKAWTVYTARAKRWSSLRIDKRPSQMEPKLALSMLITRRTCRAMTLQESQQWSKLLPSWPPCACQRLTPWKIRDTPPTNITRPVLNPRKSTLKQQLAITRHGQQVNWFQKKKVLMRVCMTKKERSSARSNTTVRSKPSICVPPLIWSTIRIQMAPFKSGHPIDHHCRRLDPQLQKSQRLPRTL